MLYADTTFYTDEYLSGRAETVPLSEFPYWSKQAGAAIDTRTFGRIDPDNIPEVLRQCACELAEFLYADSESRRADNVTAESTGGHSVSYADQRLDRAELSARREEIMRKWLSNTGLLYRGC